MLSGSKCSEQAASPEQTTRRTKSRPTEKGSKQLRWECPSCSRNFKVETPRLHSVAACDRPETNEIPKLPPIPEAVWQQPLETSINQCSFNKTNIDSTSRTTIASQTSPPKGTQPQNCVVTTEHTPRNQTGNEPVPFLIAPRTALPISKVQNSMQRVPLMEIQQLYLSPLQPH